MTLHLTSLGDKVGRELAVADPEDGVEDEDLAGTEGTLQLLDEVVVPGNSLGLAVLSAPRGLRGIDVTGDNHHTNSLEGISDNGTLRRAVDVRLAAGDEDGNTDVEHAETQEVSGPETLVLLHEGRSHERKSTDVDAPVEDHVDALVGDGRVDDNTLARLLRLDGHDAALVLVGNEGRNIGLDTTCSETDDDNGDDVAGLASTGGLGFGKSRGPENGETNPVEDAEDEDGAVLSEVLISDDGSEDRSDCER